MKTHAEDHRNDQEVPLADASVQIALTVCWYGCEPTLALALKDPLVVTYDSFDYSHEMGH